MRFFDAAQVAALLPPPAARRSQETAFRCLGNGVADLAERLILPGTGGDALAFCYAARLRPGTPPVCKFGAVAAGNRARGLPSVHAVMLALDPVTGAPLAVFDGEALTALRTPAASVVAVESLSAGPRVLAILGCGVQGRAHLRAFADAGPLAEVRLWDHTPGTAERALDPALPTRLATSARDAVDGADTVVTCTSAAEPVLAHDWLAPGATVVSIGSFAPDRCEIDVSRADAVVVDHAPTALRQAGPIIAAVAAGTLTPDRLVELGDVLATGRVVRRRPTDILYYNSVGLGVQDAAAACAILERL
jgi:ornithine cyclodeaminase